MPLQDLGCIQIDPAQRERKQGEYLQWARFPFQFDEDDLRLAKSQGIRYGTHFIEWLGAIVLYHAADHDSLVIRMTIIPANVGSKFS